ncbi:hypothetical protein L226DRAFT_452151, partial [Lentinus tigrinus ALCF2SS1-7]|uniref:uncharacterized protein n=1 Tax=Lentinus tigrinus ALCF2SS1-7 TaxID=1328758 RepID=UPI001165CA63
MLKSLETQGSLTAGELPTFDYAEWTEGTEELAGKSVEELAGMLGLLSVAVPGMNETEDPVGIVDPWTVEGQLAMDGEGAVPLGLFGHQWQGLVKLVYNLMHPRNTLLMDSVGVGKTAQAISTLLMYEFIR